MRNRYKLLIIWSILLVATCEDKKNNFGSIEVVITLNQGESQSNRVTETFSSEITKVTISISSVDPVDIDVTPGQIITETIDGVVVGEQTVIIDLKNSSGTILYTQTQTVNVTAGQTSAPTFQEDDFNAENVVIVLSSPNGGEDWELGTTYDITWSSDNDNGSVKIELYKSGSIDDTLSADEPNDGSYSWTISSELETGTDYRIRISSISDGSIFDESDGDFSLSRLLWSYVYDYAGVSDWGNSVIEVSDGYWTTGVRDGFMRLFKTDLAGNLNAEINFTSYGMGYFGYSNQVLEAYDGSLILIGGGYSGGEYAMLVVKTDEFGTEIWRHYSSFESWGYGGLLNDNGEIIIYGEEMGHAVVWALSLDGTNFNVVAFDDNMDRAKGIVKVDGGGYYIAFSKDYETKILKTNDNFAGETEVNITGYCRSISLASDGTLLTTLQTSENEHTYMKIDPLTGQTMWAGTAAGLYSGFQVGDSYYFVGHSDDGMSLFLRLDDGGNVITSSSFGSGILSGYAVTSDGGLIFTGTTSYWNDEQSNTPLYKTNRNGESGNTFNLANSPGPVFSMDINEDSNLAPIQINLKQSD